MDVLTVYSILLEKKDYKTHSHVVVVMERDGYMTDKPCGHWNKDYQYGEFPYDSVIVSSQCRDCGLEVDVSPIDKKRYAEVTLKEAMEKANEQ